MNAQYENMKQAVNKFRKSFTNVKGQWQVAFDKVTWQRISIMGTIENIQDYFSKVVERNYNP